MRPTIVAWLLAASIAPVARAQALEPRLYAPAPIGIGFCGMAFSRSTGNVVTDPSLPIENVDATVVSAVPNCGLTFGLLGRQASAALVVPLVDGVAEGDVFEERRRADRRGLGDIQARFAVNLFGGPALSPLAFARAPHGTALGASLLVVAPTGEYFPDKLINIGTNRWAFKPELGLVQPLGRFTVEAYAGVWFFTANDDFYGGAVRRQDPLGVAQFHVVYALSRRAWIAADATYYRGGQTSVNGGDKQDRQANTRAGITALVPLTAQQALRLAFSRGVSARFGTKLDTIVAGWQYTWLRRPPPRGGSA